MGCCFSHSFLEARTILGRNTGSSYEVVDDRGHSSNPPIITTSQINNTDNNSYQPPKRPKLVHSTSLRKISHAVPVPVALPNTARVTRSESVPAFLTNLNKENQIPLLQQVQAKYSIANPLESLPIAIDVPRLINNTEVKDEHGVLFERPSSDASNSRGREMLIKSFLEVLITKLRISDSESILSRYDAIVLQRMESDLPPRLKEFLITLGDDSPVIKLLKVVNQALIATAVTKIKVYFMGHFVLKDVRNGWDVVVSFGDAHAVVSHIKWEETLPAAFKLCWQLDYIFDKHTWDLKDATLRIVKLEFTALMDAEEQEGVQELVDGFSA